MAHPDGSVQALPALHHFSREGGATLDGFLPAEPPRWKMKPKGGMWVSDESDAARSWSGWCLAEGYALDRLAFRQEVRLRADANVLVVRNLAGMRALDAKYGVPTPDEPRLAGLDWSRLMADHDGLVITPFQARFHEESYLGWYAWWDCAGGILFRANCIEGIDKAEPTGLETGALVSMPKRWSAFRDLAGP